MEGLHVNLLIESGAEITAEQISARLGLDGSETWSKPIARVDLRNIAAYISKRESIPKPIDFEGRSFGTWGSWRSVRQVAMTMEARPIVALVAQVEELKALKVLPSTHGASRYPQGAKTTPHTPSRADARAIAEQYLSTIREILAK